MTRSADPLHGPTEEREAARSLSKAVEASATLPNDTCLCPFLTANFPLRLFAERNAQGVQASVYNVISKTWIAPSESVEDLEQGKERAEGHAREYLKRVANVELPALPWKESRSAWHLSAWLAWFGATS